MSRHSESQLHTAFTSIGHIAVLTRDRGRLTAFYAHVFGAEVTERSGNDERAGLGFIRLGPSLTLHAFERRDGSLGGIADEEAGRAFHQGRIDHFSLEAADLPSFSAARDRLVGLGASDGTVTDFGPLVSLFFKDPDGFQLEMSLTKTVGWDPPFPVTPFAARDVR